MNNKGIRNSKCSGCSCNTAMIEIEHYKDNTLKNDMQAMSLDEILSYGDLWWDLFQCYMDNNWIKCKWLYDFTTLLKNNPKLEKKLIQNLKLYKDTMKPRINTLNK